MPMQVKARDGGIASTHPQTWAESSRVISSTLRLIYSQERSSNASHPTGSWVGLGTGLRGHGTSRTNGIRSHDRLAQSESMM
jgi:hypothetical protein